MMQIDDEENRFDKPMTPVAAQPNPISVNQSNQCYQRYGFALLEFGSDRHIFQEACQHRLAFFAERRSHNHAIGFQTA